MGFNYIPIKILRYKTCSSDRKHQILVKMRIIDDFLLNPHFKTKSFFQGFPTLYWVPKGSKKPESYNGGRELDDFIKFISEKATDELKGYNRKGKAKKSEL